jgi:hypothetical protein
LVPSPSCFMLDEFSRLVLLSASAKNNFEHSSENFP